MRGGTSSTRSSAGVPLDVTATQMRVAPLGCRISLRLRGTMSTPRSDRSRFVASAVIEVSDLQAFVADPAKGVDVVGGIDSPEWGYRPFVGGSATVTAVDAGRMVQIEATIRVDDEDVRIVMSTTLPTRSASGSCWTAARTWSVAVSGAHGVGSGAAQLTRLDALRILYMFEPSGAHTLSDRVRALKTMVGFVRAR